MLRYRNDQRVEWKSLSGFKILLAQRSYVSICSIWSTCSTWSFWSKSCYLFIYLSSLSIWLMSMQAAILQDFLKSEIGRAENAILRDFLQKWKLQSWKRGKSMRLLQKMEIVELKTKQFCETYFIFLNVDCRPCGSVLSRFVTFWCWVLKVLRLPRKSDAESSEYSEVLRLPRNMICKI